MSESDLDEVRSVMAALCVLLDAPFNTRWLLGGFGKEEPRAQSEKDFARAVLKNASKPRLRADRRL